jgi:hypothetical protein
MLKKALFVALFAAMAVGTAAADIVCPDSSYTTVTFATTKNRVTIAPAGSASQGNETLLSNGITIHVYLKNCNGAPLVGVPPQEVVVYNAALCLCPGGNIADAATDASGHTTFTGFIRGGGCVENLTVYADGVIIGGNPITVKTNSPDAPPASPCAVDASDLAALATKLGNPAQYNICFDYNESGPPTIDAGDLAFFASALGTSCN